MPSVRAGTVRAGIQLPGSTRSPAEAIIEPAYEHGREGRIHKPCFGLCYTNPETLLPATPITQDYVIQQQSHEFSCDRPLQALFVQGKIKVGVRVFYFIHSASCDLH